MSKTPLLSLPILEASQAQKHVTHNEALLILDAAIQMSVVTRNATAPPSIPVEGARYLLGTSPSGAWAGHGGKLAVWQASGWIFSVPREGWRLWAEDDDKLFVFNGSAWNDIQAIDVLSNMSRLGVNTIADASNRLSVSSAGVLFSHAGSDQRLKINKQAAGDTGSLLFQTNFSGRAEMGLAGDDNFHVKVTADGTTWNEALVVDRVTGAVTLPNTPGDGTYAARSTLVSAVAGGLSRPNGTITYAAGLTYRWQTGAASLPGLPGLVAEGQISLRHYGAIGNGTSDDTAAVNAARGQTARISGEKLTYGVTGKISALANTWWEDLTLKQLAPAASQSVITLEASGISSLRLVRLKIDRNGNGANDGNNVAPNGPLATCLGLRIDGGQHHYFEDVEVYGRDAGSAIGLFNLDRTTKLIRPYVHDIISVVPSATDDTIQGIWMQACDGIHVVRPRIERIGWKNALGNADPVAGVAGAWKRNRAFSLSGCSQIHIDTIDMRDVDQGLDFTGDIGTGNSDCSVTNGYCYNSGSGAFSVKNLSRRIKLSHCVAELAANWGFSNQAAFDTAVDDFDANQFIGCIALDCGAGAGTNGGFVLLAGSRAYKTPAKLSACRAIDRRGVPLMSYGFYNEALNSAASRTELIDCFAGGYTAAAARGFIDPAGHDPGNSIVNANFELGGTGWNMSPSGINAFTIENDSANAASGTWVARQHNTAGENGNMRSIKTLPVVPGDIVHAGMFFKTSASPAISLLRTRILWFDKTGANIGLSSATNVTAETLAYALNAVTATAPANACAAQLEVLVTKTVGTVWIDRTFMQLKRDAANLLLDSSLTSVQMGGDITASGKSMLTAASVAAQTALIDVATGALKGLMAAADKTKLDGVATGATANAPDATLLARVNHTGTQVAATISDFAAAAAAAAPVQLNTTNAFVATQSIDVNSASPALTITQQGAGDILRGLDALGDTTLFRVDQAGNLGIGVTGPVNTGLHIRGDSSAGVGAQAYLQNRATGTGTAAELIASAGTFDLGDDRNAALRFELNASGGLDVVFLPQQAGAAKFEMARLIAHLRSFKLTAATLARGVAVARTVDAGVGLTESLTIVNKASSCTLTLPDPAAYVGREWFVKTITANPVISASANVVALAGGAAATAILPGSAGAWAFLQANGTSWEIIASGRSPAWGTFTGTLSDQADLQTALNLKAPLASPALTGVPVAPTAAPGTNTTQLASTAFATAADAALIAAHLGQSDPHPQYLTPAEGNASYSALGHGHAQADVTNLVADLAAKAALASPTFTGVPAAPTAANGTNTTQLATTAFVLANPAVVPWNAYTAALGAGQGVTEFEATVSDAGVSGSSVISLRLAATGDADENEPEFTNLMAMIARPAAGSFALALQFNELHSGPLNLQYRIN